MQTRLRDPLWERLYLAACLVFVSGVGAMLMEMRTQGVWLSVHVWTGIVVMTGIAECLVSLLAWPLPER